MSLPESCIHSQALGHLFCCSFQRKYTFSSFSSQTSAAFSPPIPVVGKLIPLSCCRNAFSLLRPFAVAQVSFMGKSAVPIATLLSLSLLSCVCLLLIKVVVYQFLSVLYASMWDLRRKHIPHVSCHLIHSQSTTSGETWDKQKTLLWQHKDSKLTFTRTIVPAGVCRVFPRDSFATHSQPAC